MKEYKKTVWGALLCTFVIAFIFGGGDRLMAGNFSGFFLVCLVVLVLFGLPTIWGAFSKQQTKEKQQGGESEES